MADTGKDAVKDAKDAEKAAIKAKKERIKNSKPKKDGSFFSRAGARIKKYWKDFIGTIKKIVWPPRKQVLKSSAVVLVSIIVVGLVIYGFDQGLTALFTLGRDTAKNLGEVYAETTVAAEEAAADANAAASANTNTNTDTVADAVTVAEATTAEAAEGETETPSETVEDVSGDQETQVEPEPETEE